MQYELWLGRCCQPHSNDSRSSDKLSRRDAAAEAGRGPAGSWPQLRLNAPKPSIGDPTGSSCSKPAWPPAAPAAAGCSVMPALLPLLLQSRLTGSLAPCCCCCACCAGCMCCTPPLSCCSCCCKKLPELLRSRPAAATGRPEQLPSRDARQPPLPPAAAAVGPLRRTLLLLSPAAGHSTPLPLLPSTTSGDSATELLRSCRMEARAARRPASRGPHGAEPPASWPAGHAATQHVKYFHTQKCTNCWSMLYMCAACHASGYHWDSGIAQASTFPVSNIVLHGTTATGGQSLGPNTCFFQWTVITYQGQVAT
jgi:hypothetical protein